MRYVEIWKVNWWWDQKIYTLHLQIGKNQFWWRGNRSPYFHRRGRHEKHYQQSASSLQLQRQNLEKWCFWNLWCSQHSQVADSLSKNNWEKFRRCSQSFWGNLVRKLLRLWFDQISLKKSWTTASNRLQSKVRALERCFRFEIEA